MASKSARIGFAAVALWQASLAACSSSDTSPKAPGAELGSTSAALVRSGDPTEVTPGTPSPRQATCPGNSLPDLCGSWAGVELHASSRYKAGSGDWVPADNDEHCHCQPIPFEVPAFLPVTEGNSGNSHAELEFRRQSGGNVICGYRGDKNGPGSTGGTRYVFDRCDGGLQPGSSVTADWFSLEIQHANSNQQKTSVQVRLGEPDVVDGVVQETVYYSGDPALLGAALYVPRGSAPPFQDFSLTGIPQIAVETTLANDGGPFTTLGPAADVHAVGQDDFSFTPVPDAQCPRIELPYSQQALEHALGPAAERLLRGRQITDIGAALGGAAALLPVGAVTVDTLRKTLTFCVEHLSFYVVGSDATTWNADLVLARLDVPNQNAPSASIGGVNLLGTTTLPTIQVSTTHVLTLEFQNTTTNGQTWSEGTAPRLVSVGSWTAGAPSDAVTPWFPNGGGAPQQVSISVWDNSNGPYGGASSSVLQNQRLRVHVPITAPLNPALLNLCLKQGSNHFGDCFSWFPTSPPVDNGSTIVAGQLSRDCYTGPAITRDVGRCEDGTMTSQLGGTWPPNTPANCPGQTLPGTEVCNYTIDDDCDGSTDEGVENPCGGCVALPDWHTACPLSDGVCSGTGQYECNGEDALRCEGSVFRNECGGCGALPDWHTPCPLSDGVCAGTGQYECNGSDALTCTGSVFRNQCLGCGVLPNAPGSDCNNGCPGHWQCDGTEGVSCDAVRPANLGEACGCGGLGIMGCNGCSVPECRRVILRMNNVDDEAYAWIGQPQWETDILGRLIPVNYICHAMRSSNGGNLDCEITDSVLAAYGGDLRSVPITIKLVNSGCFATEGRFRLEVFETDGSIVDYGLSTQSFQSIVHCGWVHRHYFTFNLVDGGGPSWPDSYPYCYPIPGNTAVHDVDCGNPAACVFDGDCFL